MSSDIDRLRRSARQLKKAFANGDPNATRRLRDYVPEPKQPRHADFLHVIARENGHRTWPELKFALEARELTRSERAERLRRALYFGQLWIIRKLLEDDPALPAQSFALQLATYDIEAVRAEIARDLTMATQPIDGRSPILHLAYSHYFRIAPERHQAMTDIADLLVSNGADVNDGFAPEPGSDHRLSALYGALGHAGNLVLARWLLEHGASPDDNESLYHATELGHREGLKLLIEFGVTTTGTNALLRALDFDDFEAVRLLLEHGADPNEAVTGHPSGQPVDSTPALHHAARRLCSAAVVKLLLDHGADGEAVWEGHTPYALASIYGNRDMIQLLGQRGFASALSHPETILADCAKGRAPSSPLDPGSLPATDRNLLTQLVWRPGSLDHVKALVAAGLDPRETDAMGLTPLHVAGWEGLPEYVAFFLTLGPDLSYRNHFGGDALETVIHGSEFCPNADSRDHIGCARLILEAGGYLNPAWIDSCGNEAMVLFLQGWNDA